MNKPKTRDKNIVIQEMNNELLIYDLKDNKAFCLNETSAIIYQLCDGKNSIADIKSKLNKNLNQPINNELIWLALDGLKKENLLENNEIETDFNGLNRRQVIRKVGLASLIALPLVSSVIAPSAVMAASAGVLALLDVCSTTLECQSGLVCINCSFGTCDGGNRCCKIGAGRFGPTQQIGCTTTSSCNTLKDTICCSGNVNFNPNNCNGFDTGICTCA